MNELTALLSKAAPWLAAAAGGPVGIAGMAIKTLAETLGATEGTVASVTSALIGATPEQVLALKAADQDFKLRMQELGFKSEADMLRIAADDRADARKMATSTGSWMPSILACAVTVGFFGTLGYLLAYGKPDTGGDALMIMLGALGSAWAQVMNFFLGSTRESGRKNDLLAQSKPAD